MLSIDTSRIAGATTGLHAKALLQIVSARSSTIAGGTWGAAGASLPALTAPREEDKDAR